MRISACLACLLSLAAAASAASLRPAARPFVSSDLVGKWERTLAFPGSENLCPREIEHAGYTVTGGVTSVPHAFIKHDGVACTSGGAMGVQPLEDALEVAEIANAFNSDTTGQVAIAVDNVVKGSDSLAGFETEERTCGSAPGIFEKGGFLLVHEDDKDVTLIPLVAVLTKGPRYAVYFAPPRPDGTFVGCLYQNADPPTNAAPSTVAASTSAATTAAPAATAAAPSSADEKADCFPASATAERADGSLARMDELAAGDVVKVAAGRYSPVFAFTHADGDAVAQFVRVETRAGKALRLTAGHYLRVGGALVAAKAVRVGDFVELGDGRVDQVVGVGRFVGKGLFNPQTVDGEIVVDGVVASTYTTAVEPLAAHAALWPVRAAFRLLGAAPLCLAHGASGLAAALPGGAAVV